MTDDRSHQTTSAYRRHQTTLIELTIDEDEYYTYLSANARESDDVRGDELKDDLFDAVQHLGAAAMGEFIPRQVDLLVKHGSGPEALANAAAVLRHAGYVVNIS